ncbi:MAG: hypothetical protein EA356_09590 [Geminicoccaceae bacterium]|nr:MAG: hypothetical protein EA356_09590 [Geminicoccaceae bacterium]
MARARFAVAGSRARVRRIAGPTGVAIVCMMALLIAGPSCAEVRLAGSSWIVDAPTKIADALGFFNQGLGTDDPDRVTVFYTDSGRTSLDALRRGETTFALAAPSPVAADVLRRADLAESGDDIVVLASVGLSNQSHDIVASRRRGIAGPADLAGRRIAVVEGSSAHYTWEAFTAAHGIATGSVELEDIPPRHQAAALAAGEVDAVVSWEPYLARMVAALGDDAVRFSTRQVHTANWLLLTTRRVADERPDWVDRVLLGYLQAIAFREADPMAADRLHADVAGLDDETLAELKANVVWRVDLGWSVLANLEGQLAWSGREAGLRELPPPARYLDARGLFRVAPERVVVPRLLLEPTAAAGEAVRP